MKKKIAKILLLIGLGILLIVSAFIIIAQVPVKKEVQKFNSDDYNDCYIDYDFETAKYKIGFHKEGLDFETTKYVYVKCTSLRVYYETTTTDKKFHCELETIYTENIFKRGTVTSSGFLIVYI